MAISRRKFIGDAAALASTALGTTGVYSLRNSNQTPSVLPQIQVDSNAHLHEHGIGYVARGYELLNAARADGAARRCTRLRHEDGRPLREVMEEVFLDELSKTQLGRDLDDNMQRYFARMCIYGQITTETNWQINAVSPVGARGLWQFMPGTARAMSNRMGYAFDPTDTIASTRATVHLYDTHYEAIKNQVEQISEMYGLHQSEFLIPILINSHHNGALDDSHYRHVPGDNHGMTYILDWFLATYDERDVRRYIGHPPPYGEDLFVMIAEEADRVESHNNRGWSRALDSYGQFSRKYYFTARALANLMLERFDEPRLTDNIPSGYRSTETTLEKLTPDSVSSAIRDLRLLPLVGIIAGIGTVSSVAPEVVPPYKGRKVVPTARNIKNRLKFVVPAAFAVYLGATAFDSCDELPNIDIVDIFDGDESAAGQPTRPENSTWPIGQNLTPLSPTNDNVTTPNLILRGTNGVFTGGTPGRYINGNGRGVTNETRAAQALDQLMEEYGIQHVVSIVQAQYEINSLEGAIDAFDRLESHEVAELHNWANNRERSEREWDENMTKVAKCVLQGNCLIHCREGMDRSVLTTMVAQTIVFPPNNSDLTDEDRQNAQTFNMPVELAYTFRTSGVELTAERVNRFGSGFYGLATGLINAPERVNAIRENIGL